ncbi:MAG: hypothetical protein LBQ52_04905 [Helicobacteraceae bacterium]|jgi:succinate dehydrogenase hydrophobic anchor subunit|nr:hypothetical protein [Helicobacteraceae bacterium]
MGKSKEGKTGFAAMYFMSALMAVLIGVLLVVYCINATSVEATTQAQEVVVDGSLNEESLFLLDKDAFETILTTVLVLCFFMMALIAPANINPFLAIPFSAVFLFLVLVDTEWLRHAGAGVWSICLVVLLALLILANALEDMCLRYIYRDKNEQ